MLGHELLKSIQSIATPQNVAAMLRHAERHAISDPAQPMLAELTTNGIAAAKALGERITGFQHLRLFHSPVKRCRQTAENIAEGAAKSGIFVELIGPQEALGVSYIQDLAEAGHMHHKHGDDFIRLWFTGQVPTSIILSPDGIATRKIVHVSQHLAEETSHGRRLDLHVSHDWNIIIMRELLLGVQHEQAGWLNFLDGVAFSQTKEGILTAIYRNEHRSCNLPWDQFIRRA